MTAVVGLVHDGAVYIGADSACSDGWRESIRRDGKVFARGPYVFGFTTSYRMGQLLHHDLVPPPPMLRNLDQFMVVTFVNAVRDCLKAAGWAKKDSEREEGGEFLVGVAGRLFTIHGDYQVAEDDAPWTAVGAGYLVALGAMHALAHHSLTPRAKITAALRAAERYTAGVRGPFEIVKTRVQSGG